MAIRWRAWDWLTINRPRTSLQNAVAAAGAVLGMDPLDRPDIHWRKTCWKKPSASGRLLGLS